MKDSPTISKLNHISPVGVCRWVIMPILIVFFSASIGPSFSWAVNEEAKGKIAENEGRFSDAFQHYMAALKTAEILDAPLIEKIINLTKKLNPAPSLPEEVRRYAIRAMTFVENAKNHNDYVLAFSEFGKAIRLAPWWSDVYLNYGLSQEAAEEFTGAIKNYQLFLLAAPNDPAAREVQNKIYALEARAAQFAANAIGVVHEINQQWGLVLIQFNPSTSTKPGESVYVKDRKGNRLKMTIKRISGNKASAIPSGNLATIPVGGNVV